uniref:TLC domain-containing protein n=1 Tax=Plectus sambesii TaxID=2011161 RepID=A0A914XD52_9BILA
MEQQQQQLERTMAATSNGTGAEFRMPDWRRLTDADMVIPCVVYFVFFQLMGALVRRTCWMHASGFRQYRLRNLTICLLHSVISGGWALCFMLTHTRVMFYDTMHWYQYWAAQLPMLSMSYFVCDTIDMAKHEFSRWTVELFVHHIVTVFVFGVATMARKFIPYAYWALLMEVNSIFLHLRSIILISGTATEQKGALRAVRAGNIVTFVVFRFAVQAWQIHWAYVNRAEMHYFFALIGVVGGVIFLIINTVLFARVLAADGFLGEYGRRHTAINRDADRNANKRE